MAGKRTEKRSEERGEPIQDPVVIRDALQALLESEGEFPIKVEGTSTLPYASVIQELFPEGRYLILKLVRPLPHEMMAGAVFKAVLPVADQRFEGLMTFQGREGYLRYRFSIPQELIHADRRRHPRYPFRPRENAYVIAKDAGIPGLGIAGPLMNLGLGGLAIRVDRVIRLDTGMRIPPNTALFDRGKRLPRTRIQDLPRLPIFECGATVMHTLERGSEILLGLSFGELDEDEARPLRDSLAFRQKLLTASASVRLGSGEAGATRPATESGGHRLEPPPANLAAGSEEGQAELVDLGPDPLLRLQRRTTPLALAMASGGIRNALLDRLGDLGYLRIEQFQTLGELKTALTEGAKPSLLLVDLALAGVGDEEPIAAMRRLEAELESSEGIPLALLCDLVDPTLLLGAGGRTRLLAYEPDKGDEGPWEELIDGLAGLAE